MSIPKTEEKLQEHKLQTLQEMDTYLADLIASGNEQAASKADKLCYWLKDWINFLSFEEGFSPHEFAPI